MNTCLKITCALTIVGAVCFNPISTTHAAVAKSGPLKIVKAVSISSDPSQDKNIKVGAVAKPIAPMRKPHLKGRGADTATIHFDNHSSLPVKCYIDGVYQGTVDPYDDLFVTVDTNSHVLYCRADRAKSNSLQFGPDSAFIGYSGYTYELTE